MHGADFEGTRFCGATGGLKTVYAADVVTCPECRAIIKMRATGTVVLPGEE